MKLIKKSLSCFLALTMTTTMFPVSQLTVGAVDVNVAESGIPQTVIETAPAGDEWVIPDEEKPETPESNEPDESGFVISDGVLTGCSDIGGVITIPADVIEIGEKAFINNRSITGVKFASGSKLTKIGRSAFKECFELNNIELPDTLEEIGAGAFCNCDALESISLPASLKTTGYGNFPYLANLTSVRITSGGIFAGCDNLKNVTFKKGLDAIPENVLRGIESITTVYIPRSVGSIGANAFNGCTGIENIYFGLNDDGDNEEFKLTEIPADAFSGLKSLKSFTMPNSVKTVGASAFQNCSAMTEITLSNQLTEIPNYMFAGCSSLAEVQFPDSVKTMGTHVFQSCTSLVKGDLASNITEIPAYTYDGCKLLTTVYGTVPSGVTAIGEYAFRGCTAFTDCIFKKNYSSIGNYAFQNCTSLEKIEISSATEIGSYAFSGCTGAKTLTIAKADKIGASAFAGCTALEAVTLPELTEIGNKAFTGDTALTTVTAKAIGTIGSEAFSGCTSLVTANLGYWLISLGSSAFKGCSSLTIFIIPSVLTSIPANAFADCVKLEKLYVPGSVTSINSSALNTPDVTTICGFAGSAAETFATKNNYKFTGYEDTTPIFSVSVWKYSGETKYNFKINGNISGYPYYFYQLDYGKNVTVNGKSQRYFRIDPANFDGTLPYNGDVSVVLRASKDNVIWTDYNSDIIAKIKTAQTCGSTTVTATPGKDNVVFTWTKAANATYYSVQALVDGVYKTLANLDSSTLTYTVSTLSSSTEYNFRVTPWYKNGNYLVCGGDSDIKATTLPDKEVAGWELTSPNKITYFIGDQLDLTGGKIVVTYKDGTKEEIALNDSSVSVSGFSSETAGTKVIKVTFGDKSFSFSVVVNNIEISSIDIGIRPTKKEYFKTESIDLTGGTIIVKYNNGKQETVKMLGNVKVVGYNNSKLGSQKIKIEYNGVKSTNAFEVIVCEIVGLEIGVLPNKTTYFVNSQLDFTGGKILLTLSDGKSSKESYIDMTDSNLTAKIDSYDKNMTKVETSTIDMSDPSNLKIPNSDLSWEGFRVVLFDHKYYATSDDDMCFFTIYFNDTNSYFVIGRDNNDFFHNNADDATLKSLGWPKVYYPSGFSFSDNKSYDDYNDMTNEDWFKFSPLINGNEGIAKKITTRIYEEWGGSCYGISMTMGLLKSNFLTVSDLTNNTEIINNSNSYHSLPKPINDKKFLSAITFFYMSQYLNQIKYDIGGHEKFVPISKITTARFPTVGGGFLDYTSGNDVFREVKKDNIKTCSDFLLSLIEASANKKKSEIKSGEKVKNKTLLFEYFYCVRDEKDEVIDSNGHAVLITGVEKINDSEYQLEIYDMNSYPYCNFYYMTVRYDWLKGYTFSYKLGDYMLEDTYISMRYVDLDHLSNDTKEIVNAFKSSPKSGISKLTPAIDSDPNELSDETITITFKVKDNFTLKNADNQCLSYNGLEISGDMPIYSIALEGDNANNIRYVLEIDKSEFFYLESLEKGICFDVYSQDDFMSLTGENIESATMKLGSDMKITGSDYSFKAYMSTNDEPTGEHSLMSVEAEASDDVTLTADGNNVKAESDNGLDNVKVNVFEDLDIKTTTEEDHVENITVNTVTGDTEKDVTNKPVYTGTRVVIGKDAPTIADAVKSINTAIKNKNAKESYIFVIDSAITEKKAIALPKGNISIVLLSEDNGSLTLANPTITANCDLTIDCTLESGKTGKPITIKAAKDKTVTINRADTKSAFNLSGAKSSKLVINADITAETVKTFDSINGEGTLTIKKALSGANIGTATLAYDLTIAKKIVVPAITGNLTIAADEIKSGTTIFQYTGKAAFDGSKVTIGDGSLEAFAYKKDVRAMENGVLTVDGTDYPDFEQAFAAMQPDKEYTVVLNGDVPATKLTLPKTVKKLTIDGCGNTVKVEGALSLAPKYMFEMKNLNVKANKGGTSQAVTINAQGGLLIDDVTFDAKSVALKGKGALELGDTSKIDTVSGFTTAKITGAVAIAKSIAVPTIELAGTAVVTLDGKNATVTAKTKFSGEEGSQLVLKPGFKAITLSATESAVTGNVILNTDAISGTVQVFATKIPAAALAKVFAPTKGELIAGKSGKVNITI